MSLPPRSRIGAYFAIGLLAIVVAIVLGFVAASGFLIGQIVIAGAMAGAFLLLLPPGPLVLLLVLGTFVIQGTAAYFLKLQQLAWLPYVLCILVSIKAISFREVGRAHRDNTRLTSPWATATAIFLVLYILSLLFSTLLNQPPLIQVVVGLKNALPIWIAAALVFQGARDPAFRDIIWRSLAAIFFIQIPLVLYQHFVVIPSRRDLTTAMDAVVGTFGGLIDGGGSNSTLVIFALLVMAYSLALWLRKSISLRRALLFWAVGFIIIFSGEVKAALIWIPLTLVYVLRRQMISNFGSMVATVLVGTLTISTLFLAYDALYWSKSGPQRSASELVERMTYFFDESNINYRSGEISRGASLSLWAKDSATDPAHRILGYGPGASRISATGGLGQVAKRFAPLGITATGAALLLWDVGLFGFLAFVGLLASTLLAIRRCSNDTRTPPIEAARLDALGSMILIFGSLLFYNRSLLDEPSIQLLLSIAVGYSLFWTVQLKYAETAPTRQHRKYGAPVKRFANPA
jgi:hypothetical protein